MKRMFSEEQLAAIFTPGNVIVSAGAGSGKTTVMVERIVGKLAEGHKLDRMLIVTFTRAAASDIRIKLSERLTELKNGGALADGGEKYGNSPRVDLKSAAAEALDVLPVCNIGTLHSFCQRLIRNYYYAAGIDPTSVLLEENDAAAMEVDCVAKAVRNARERGDDFACELFDALSSRRDDGGAETAVKTTLDFALSLSDTRGYLSNVESDCERYDELRALIADRKSELLKEIELLCADVAAAKFTTIENAVRELIPFMEGKIDEITRTQYRGKDGVCTELNERFKALKKRVADAATDFRKAQKAYAIDSAPYGRALCATALAALDLYESRKAASGRIDYSDLEHGAMNVLGDPECMSEIKNALDFVFIDEYQDVNPLQADIAERLKNGAEAEMFLVGDIKQSIYAFRRCNPIYFERALSDPDYTAIRLNRNYRSSQEAVDFINSVFDGVMSGEFGGADYATDRLVCGCGTHGKAEFFAVRDEAREKNDDGVPYSVVNAKKGVEKPDEQARLIVDAILEYVASGEGGLGDIAVLVRSARTAFCDSLVALLRKNGIPVNLGRKSTVSDYPETEELLGIARCVDNRFDDVALYTALRSSMGGFSDAELFEIAAHGEKIAAEKKVRPEFSGAGGRQSYFFWQKAAEYRGRLRGRLDAFFAKRDEFSEYAAKHDAGDALGYITSETDFFQCVYERGGNAAAVEALIASATSLKCALSSFLYGVSGDTELCVGDGGDAVTVTTVHASKGLEYDFVIVADIGRKFNMKDVYRRTIPTARGVAVKCPDASTHTLVESAPYILEKSRLRYEMRSEELRLFYVALTRAKRRLFVCGRPPEKSRRATEAVCGYDFMQNVLPSERKAERRACDDLSERPDEIDAAVVDAVKNKCAFVYPLVSSPIKTCVTAIAEKSDEDYTTAAPVLTADDCVRSGSDGFGGMEVDAARRGTAYHRAMELVDFDDPDTERVKSNMSDAELVDFDRVVNAARTVKQLTAKSSAYFKERYFIADLPVNGENALVQGVIDLLILYSDGTAAILDYKTTKGDIERSEAYRSQLRLYAQAVEKTAPYRVTAAYLYSFLQERLIKVENFRAEGQ